MQGRLQNKITYRRIWQIALPIILGSLAQNVINVTDTAFLGHVGEVALGASALGGIFYIVIIMLGWGFGIGTQIIVARRNGEMKHKEIGKIIEHALYFLIPLSIVIFLLIRFLSPALLGSVVNSDNVLEATNLFLKYRIWGIFFAFTNITFRAFYIGIARTKVITWSTAVLAAINVFLDWCLIFGNLGFPEMGIAGAALASVIAEVFTTAFFITYTLIYVPLKKYRLFYFARLSFVLLKKLLNVALPVMLQNFLSIAGWYIFFLMVESMGEHELAISNIIRSIYIVIMIPVFAFAATTNTMVSQAIGEGRSDNVIPIIKKIVTMSLLSVLALAVFNSVFPHLLLSLYTDNAQLITDSLPVLYVVGGSALFISVGFQVFSGVSGTGNTRISLAIEILVIIVYLITTHLLVNVLNSSITTVWFVEYVYGFSIGILAFFYLRSGKWKEKKL